MKAILVTFLFLLISQVVFARYDGCPSRLRNNHLVISFEGLGNSGFSKANISNRYASSIGYSPANYPFERENTAGNCIIHWKKRLGSQLRLSIIGHSCGGDAAIRLANKLGTRGIRINSMLTLDPRCHTSPLPFGIGQSYRKPDNVDQFVNMRGTWGHEVRGAKRCFTLSHTLTPFSPRVQRIAQTMLSGGIVGDCRGSAADNHNSVAIAPPPGANPSPGNLNPPPGARPQPQYRDQNVTGNAEAIDYAQDEYEEVPQYTDNSTSEEVNYADTEPPVTEQQTYTPPRSTNQYVRYKGHMIRADKMGKPAICRYNRKCTYEEATVENSRMNHSR